MAAAKRSARLTGLERKAREIGHAIGSSLDSKTGFVLVLYDYGSGGVMTFISSGHRGDTIRMLEELVRNIKAEQS